MYSVLRELGVKDDIFDMLDRLEIRVRSHKEDLLNNHVHAGTIAYVKPTTCNSNIFVVEQMLREEVENGRLCANYILFHETGHLLSKRSNSYTWRELSKYIVGDSNELNVSPRDFFHVRKLNTMEECVADFIARNLLQVNKMVVNRALIDRLDAFRSIIGEASYVQAFKHHMSILDKHRHIIGGNS